MNRIDALMLRELYTSTRKLVTDGVDDEGSYIPHVRAYIQACKDYEGPQKAASGMTKSMKRKAKTEGEPKKKANRKPEPAA